MHGESGCLLPDLFFGPDALIPCLGVEDTRGYLSAEIASIPCVRVLCVFVHAASLQGEFRCLTWCLAAISVAGLSCFLALCSIYSTRHKEFSGIVSRGNGESPVD